MVRCRVAGVFGATLLAFCLLLLVYCEFVHHYMVIVQCAWSAAPGRRLMVLADTHLLGSRTGHWFDRLRREWQMHRTYMSAVTVLKPDIVVFLGDLYDEGQWADATEFAETARRFERLFPLSDGQRRLVAAGNHDIGFHYHARPPLWRRFDAAHGSAGVLMTSLDDNVHVVLVNSVAMQGDSCQLCAAADRQLTTVAEMLRCSEKPDEKCDPSLPTLAKFSRPILFQHFPLHRASDAHCQGEDTAPASSRDKPFRPGWECLSAEASRALLGRLRPRLVASGHTHHHCITEHQLDGAGGETVTEYSVPSFNWRNRADPSFLMLTVSGDSVSVDKCRAADERTVVALYMVGVPAALVLSFIVTARRRVIRRWRDATPPAHGRDGKCE